MDVTRYSGSTTKQVSAAARINRCAIALADRIDDIPAEYVELMMTRWGPGALWGCFDLFDPTSESNGEFSRAQNRWRLFGATMVTFEDTGSNWSIPSTPPAS